MSPTSHLSTVLSPYIYTFLNYSILNYFVTAVLFDNTDIRNWIRNIEQHASDNVNKILVGNKADMDESKRVHHSFYPWCSFIPYPHFEVVVKCSVFPEDY